jgi:hypothetical protein
MTVRPASPPGSPRSELLESDDRSDILPDGPSARRGNADSVVTGRILHRPVGLGADAGRAERATLPLEERTPPTCP